MDVTGKRVLVTGGTRGIGRGIVEAFLAGGARVALNGSTAASTAKAVAELAAADRVVAAPGTVATIEGCRAIVEAAVDGLGGLDVLVNNAGMLADRQSLEAATEADWDANIDTNLKGVFFATKFAAPALRASKGNIINISSISGTGIDWERPIYGASKAALVHLTRSHARELGPDIRVNVVCPGPILTDLVRDVAVKVYGGLEPGLEAIRGWVPTMGRIGTVEEVAHQVVFLASDMASFTTGASIVIDGGASIG